MFNIFDIVDMITEESKNHSTAEIQDYLDRIDSFDTEQATSDSLPLYVHDCESCTFWGSGDMCDVYTHGDTLIIRRSDEPSEYWSICEDGPCDPLVFAKEWIARHRA